MKLFNKKLINVYLHFLIFVFLFSFTNFFLNSYIILKKNYTERMIFYGGYCDKQGYGFTKYIFEKYANKLKHNIISTTVSAPVQFPPPHGHFFQYDKILSNKYLILLNPKPEDLEIVYFRKGYKIIESKGNCYFASKK